MTTENEPMADESSCLTYGYFIPLEATHEVPVDASGEVTYNLLKCCQRQNYHRNLLDRGQTGITPAHPTLPPHFPQKKPGEKTKHTTSYLNDLVPNTV